jgi:hypothetical protein
MPDIDAKKIEELCERLDQRAIFARAEDTATALADAIHFEEAAALIRHLSSRVEEEKRATAGWKEACRKAGVCMSCAIAMPDPYGCGDCLNTGWELGAPVGYISETAFGMRQNITTLLSSEVQTLRGALQKIACPHVTQGHLWWQLEARRALAVVKDISNA